MLQLTERCCLFFCLPLTETDFVKGSNNPDKDFVFSFTHDQDSEGTWDNYEQQVAAPFTTFSDYFSLAGLMVHSNGTYVDFVTLVNSKISDVIILLTHCRSGGNSKEESIEFYDRMVSSDEILKTRLENYPLILDISVCNPMHLKIKMPKCHPGYACFCSEEEKDLTVWLYLYGLIFQEMHNKKIGFMKAYENNFRRIFIT